MKKALFVLLLSALLTGCIQETVPSGVRVTDERSAELRCASYGGSLGSFETQTITLFGFVLSETHTFTCKFKHTNFRMSYYDHDYI